MRIKLIALGWYWVTMIFWCQTNPEIHCTPAMYNVPDKKKCFVLNIMHGWGAVDFRICLAPKYHIYSISAQSYEFCTHLAQLDTFDFTLSLNKLKVWAWLGLGSEGSGISKLTSAQAQKEVGFPSWARLWLGNKSGFELSLGLGSIHPNLTLYPNSLISV